jgi:hypothetical protein
MLEITIFNNGVFYFGGGPGPLAHPIYMPLILTDRFKIFLKLAEPINIPKKKKKDKTKIFN